MTKYEILLKTRKQLFSLDDLAILWQSDSRREAIELAKWYAHSGKLHRIHKGVYSIDKDYNPFALAAKLNPPAYITYYTALAQHGLIFQQYTEVHLFGRRSARHIIDGQTYVFHQVKPSILLNTEGIVQTPDYAVASPERAICDSMYLSKSIAIDHFYHINLDKLVKISSIYQQKQLMRDIAKLALIIKDEYAK